MLRTIDRIYFNLRNINRDPDQLWHEGYEAGVSAAKAQILASLSEKSIAGFNDASLTLGYSHAVSVVKGEIK